MPPNNEKLYYPAFKGHLYKTLIRPTENYGAEITDPDK